MNKILTVLVPVYNTELYIKRCLDSLILNEVLDDIEVLVVSDGSKDSSVDIVKSYEKKYPSTIKLIEKENGGHGSTINKGLEVASGKYFRVLDSDDWVNVEGFIKFVKRLKKEDADLVVTNYKQVHVYDQHEVFNRYDNLKENVIYDFDSFDLELLNGEYFVMATSTYKTEKLREAGLQLLEKTFYVDMQYNIQPIIAVQNFVYYDLDIYRYYIGRKDQSVNINSFVRNKDFHEKVVKNILEYYLKNKKSYSPNKCAYIEMILIYLLNTHYTIYCDYDKNNKEAYKQIKEFDIYFKKLSLDLYNKSNSLGLLRYNRKTNFLCVKYKLFRKSFSFLSRLKRLILGRSG